MNSKQNIHNEYSKVSEKLPVELQNFLKGYVSARVLSNVVYLYNNDLLLDCLKPSLQENTLKESPMRLFDMRCQIIKVAYESKQNLALYNILLYNEDLTDKDLHLIRDVVALHPNLMTEEPIHEILKRKFSSDPILCYLRARMRGINPELSAKLSEYDTGLTIYAVNLYNTTGSLAELEPYKGKKNVALWMNLCSKYNLNKEDYLALLEELQNYNPHKDLDCPDAKNLFKLQSIYPEAELHLGKPYSNVINILKSKGCYQVDTRAKLAPLNSVPTYYWGNYKATIFLKLHDILTGEDHSTFYEVPELNLIWYSLILQGKAELSYLTTNLSGEELKAIADTLMPQLKQKAFLGQDEAVTLLSLTYDTQFI